MELKQSQKSGLGPTETASHARICAIIPAYNEQENISATLNDISSSRPDIVPIVVNDASTDNTMQVARRNGVVLICQVVNLGIGGTVQTGLRYAHDHNYEIVIQFDGDGQHLASEIDRIIQPIIDNDADIVIGSRFLDKQQNEVGSMRRVGIRLLQGVISFVTGRHFTDPTSGFRAYGPDAVTYLAEFYPQDYPEPEAIVDLHRHGFRLKEVSVRMRARTGGKSSIGPLKSIYYMVKVILATLVAATRRHRS